MEGEPQRRRKFYGRLHGKALRASHRRLIAEMLPSLALPGVGRFGDPARAPLDVSALFGGRPLWLEIGFGGGEHLARQAAAHPDIAFVGCEPFVNGVAKLLARVEAGGLANVRVHPGDARDLLDLLPDASVDRVFLLYPDPWPKTRHRERRFVNAANLAALARVMAPEAELRLATDIEAYVRHAVREAEAGGFAVDGRPDAWRKPWAEWESTRFEMRALTEGRSSNYLTFRKRSDIAPSQAGTRPADAEPVPSDP